MDPEALPPEAVERPDAGLLRGGRRRILQHADDLQWASRVGLVRWVLEVAESRLECSRGSEALWIPKHSDLASGSFASRSRAACTQLHSTGMEELGRLGLAHIDTSRLLWDGCHNLNLMLAFEGILNMLLTASACTMT